MESTKTIVARKQPDGLAILNLLGITIFCVAFTIAGWYDTTDMFILGLILAIAFVPASVNALCWQFFGKETFVFNGDNVDIVKNYLFFSSKQTVDYCQIQSIDVPKNRQCYANPFYGLKVLLQAFFLAGGAIELHKKGGSTITCCQGDKKNTAVIVKEFRLRCSSISLQESSPNKNSYSSYRKDYLSK